MMFKEEKPQAFENIDSIFSRLKGTNDFFELSAQQLENNFGLSAAQTPSKPINKNSRQVTPESSPWSSPGSSPVREYNGNKNMLQPAVPVTQEV